MTDAEKLSMLKADLELLTNTKDDYLSFLLELAAAAIKREGAYDDGSADYNFCQISYAAWVYRKRAASTHSPTQGTGFAPSGGETAMPRFLRRPLNNIIHSQKARETHDVR